MFCPIHTTWSVLLPVLIVASGACYYSVPMKVVLGHLKAVVCFFSKRHLEKESYTAISCYPNNDSIPT